MTIIRTARCRQASFYTKRYIEGTREHSKSDSKSPSIPHRNATKYVSFSKYEYINTTTQYHLYLCLNLFRNSIVSRRLPPESREPALSHARPSLSPLGGEYLRRVITLRWNSPSEYLSSDRFGCKEECGTLGIGSARLWISAEKCRRKGKTFSGLIFPVTSGPH